MDFPYVTASRDYAGGAVFYRNMGCFVLPTRRATLWDLLRHQDGRLCPTKSAEKLVVFGVARNGLRLDINDSKSLY